MDLTRKPSSMVAEPSNQHRSKIKLANFQAKEKQDLYPGYNATPEKIREPLSKFGDNTSVNHYFFQSATASVEDVCSPGYFDWMRDSFRSGRSKSVIHLVSCYLGTISEGLTVVDLSLIDAPSPSGGNVIMAPVTRFEPVKADKAA